MSSTGNKRLDIVFGIALGLAELRDVVLLDGYNGKVLTDGVAFTITTRTFGDNNHFLLEINESGDNSRLVESE